MRPIIALVVLFIVFNNKEYKFILVIVFTLKVTKGVDKNTFTDEHCPLLCEICLWLN